MYLPNKLVSPSPPPGKGQQKIVGGSAPTGVSLVLRCLPRKAPRVMNGGEITIGIDGGRDESARPSSRDE